MFNRFRSHECRGFAIRVVLGLGDGAGGGERGGVADLMLGVVHNTIFRCGIQRVIAS